ncbi:MAG: hypothetical protein FWC60_05770, partial [Firmicutes bacterium]|nr:hypothetical protein [Bacillota bacterium]
MTINNNQRASAPNAPYTYKTGINDTVSLNNGSLRHEEKIAYLPGRNSLDLDLTMVYNAAESDSLMGGDELSPWPVKSLGHGWSMNFTRQLRMGDLTYFRFTDGSTYQYANGVLQNYKLSDITVTNNNGALTLNYADGRKEAFDANGNLTSITDRFGNRISLQYYPETKTATGPTTIWLKPDGTVWACGNNDYGQLGDGTTTSRSTMVQVSDLTNIVAVAASPFHSVALKSDGTVWTWGRNDYGQLGNGTSANQSIPAQIKGLTDITSVTAGEYNTFALQSDGTVWAWGNNNYGILGDGLTLNQATPVQIKALTGILAIAAGEAHTAALKPDGTIWAWGLNDHGQLGDGTTIDRTTPVQVSGLTGATDIAVGAHRTIALKSDGTVWAWGQDNHCEQCHDTANSKLTPVQVRELKDVVAIA